jgi:hypothetical protein
VVVEPGRRGEGHGTGGEGSGGVGWLLLLVTALLHLVPYLLPCHPWMLCFQVLHHHRV